jgi:hypothetical protein
MSDTYSIKVDGCEVGRVSGERIELGKRLVDRFNGVMEDDPRMMRIVRDGKSVAVFYVSMADNITVEKLPAPVEFFVHPIEKEGA